MAVLGVAVGSAAAAAEVESGVDLPRTVEVGEETLHLVSCGTRDVLWAEIFVAALYVPQAGISAVGEPREAKAVSLTVLDGSILPDQVPEKYREALQRTVPAPDLQTIRTHLSRLAEGDTVWLTVTPDGALVVSINDDVIARIRARDVVQAILQAWSDDQDWQGKLREMVSDHPC